MNPLANPLASITPLPPQQQMVASKRQGANPLLDWVGNAEPPTAPMSNTARSGNPLGDAMPAMSAGGPGAQTQGGPVSGMPYGAGQAKQGNPLGAAFGSFARGFLGPERTGQLDAAHTERENAKLTKTLTWLQQTAAQPAEQRAAFTQRFAQQIAADTGQPVEAIMASLRDPNGFSDQSIQQGIAALSAQLGQAPEQPEYMNLGGGNVGMTRGGEFSMVREAPQAAEPTWDEVNGRIIDKSDPTRVIADYSDGGKPQAMDKFQDAEGNWYYVDPQSGEKRPVGIRGRVPGSGDGDGPQLTPYQLYQIQRDAEKDADADKAAGVKTENAMYSLQEGIGLVDQLVKHKGFQTIYGVQGALPVMPGTDGADALAMLEQIGGQAFLAGVETMRGTGPLSDNEGRKVAAARTRLLNRGQSPEAAAQAAREFNASMQRLLAAYEQESGIKLQAPVSAQAGPAQAASMGAGGASGVAGSVARRAAQSAPAQLPPGVTQEMWDVMDDEDRAAFQ